MYLKHLEITGFKSFGERTRLDFEPGVTAIVGPNGCGKSNVSDAIRWVLGEQRPTALRCAKMHDVVFNGTDSRKPLGMAEVSITFAGCEGILSTEFDEVTVSRRVFRSGEGQYFINKQPARLKDIHRLFMGTGIGTTSYSVMAQGQIDAILSSRPEDRRAVFEEAAGITKFKADRKEAMRKIDQTDANLLRLADVIREVKRQIGSLQRQAGKARRYKELRDELRNLDVFLTRGKLIALDERLKQNHEALEQLAADILDVQNQVADAEQGTSALHEKMHVGEQQISQLSEQAAQIDGKHARAQDIIRLNEQRIDEYRQWAQRDNQEIFQTQAQIDGLKLQKVSYAEQRQTLADVLETGKEQLEQIQEEFAACRTEIDAARSTVQSSRVETMQCERRASELQNKLAEIEARQRELIAQRSRLSAERDQLAHTLEYAERTRTEVLERFQGAKAEAEAAEERLAELLDEQSELTAFLRETRETLGRQQSEAAARSAQIDLLKAQETSADVFPAGSRLLLDAENPLDIDRVAVCGTLADIIGAPSDLRLAIEVALRAWMDAVVVASDADARNILEILKRRADAATRLVTASSGTPCNLSEWAGQKRLIDALTVIGDYRGVLERLLGSVFLFDSLAAIPAEIPAGCVAVSKDGAMVSASGCVELWVADEQAASPFARRMLLTEAQQAWESLQTSIKELSAQIESSQTRADAVTSLAASSRKELEAVQRKAAQADGERQSAERETERVSGTLVQVTAKFEALQSGMAGDDEEQAVIKEELTELLARRNELFEIVQTKQQHLQELEAGYNEVSVRLTECRIQVSGISQQLENAVAHDEVLTARITELARTVEGREYGINAYHESIKNLQGEIEKLTESLEPLRQEAARVHEQIEAAREARLQLARELERSDLQLGEHRNRLERARDQRAKIDLEQTESRLRRQGLLERMFSDYALAEREVFAEADPKWEGGEPLAPAEVESRVAALNADIQALGPVNLVAIEEYKEYEERYAFLKEQEADLIKSKEQIVDLIRMINKKTGEMFQSTFDQANANFERMFTKLFNGGQAKLVLLQDSEDPLECGIDVIARPPGKRPQTISLLSGGERTMTAVSLLFAIFMIKPAPFCLLDELDAALDDSNIGRFVGALKDFLVHSQFLIITHNQYTIAGSDLVYGVTQQEKGVSKVVSMRLPQQKQPPKPEQPTEPVPTETTEMEA